MLMVGSTHPSYGLDFFSAIAIAATHIGVTHRWGGFYPINIDETRMVDTRPSVLFFYLL